MSDGDVFFFFNDTATTEIYTLSLHDALPISRGRRGTPRRRTPRARRAMACRNARRAGTPPEPRVAAAPCHGRRKRVRSEEHTSELQSRQYLVCRLLLAKKIIGLRLSTLLTSI